MCRDLGRAVFGDRWGVWAIAPFQWSVLIGLAITYTATAGQSLQVWQSICRTRLPQQICLVQQELRAACTLEHTCAMCCGSRCLCHGAQPDELGAR